MKLDSGSISRREFVRAGFALPVAAGIAGAGVATPAEPEKDAAAVPLAELHFEPPPPNPPAAERICIALWAVLDACKELLEDPAHQGADGCDCDFCTDARGLLYIVGIVEAAFRCGLVNFPALWERYAKEAREEGKLERAERCDEMADLVRLRRQHSQPEGSHHD